MRRWPWLLTVMTAVAICARAESIDEPLQLSNQQPFVQLFNLPAMRSGNVLAPDAAVWRAAISVANNFVRSEHDDESLVIDGESQRYEFGVRRGIGAAFEIGASVPWIAYNGGVLDSVIEGWHNVWGLPDGGRPDFAKRQLAINYQRRGRTELDFHRAESGFGDMQLSAAWQLLQGPQTALALAGHISLPTGDADNLTGSGKAAAGLTLAATHQQLFDLPLTLSGNLGAQWSPRGDVLGSHQKQSVWFASTEINWAVAQDWRLKAQLQAHSALYTSDLRALGSDAMLLLLGGSVNLSKHWLLDVAVGEDIAVDTAPDVTLQLALRALLIRNAKNF